MNMITLHLSALDSQDEICVALHSCSGSFALRFHPINRATVQSGKFVVATEIAHCTSFQKISLL
jgi:hypothetical protein